MSVEENKALIRRYIDEVIYTRDLDRDGEFIVPELVEESRLHIGQLFESFSDLRVRIDAFFGEGDSARGTDSTEGVTVDADGRARGFRPAHRPRRRHPRALLDVAGGCVAALTVPPRSMAWTVNAAPRMGRAGANAWSPVAPCTEDERRAAEGSGCEKLRGQETGP